MKSASSTRLGRLTFVRVDMVAAEERRINAKKNAAQKEAASKEPQVQK
jgi:hypothetical protein